MDYLEFLRKRNMLVHLNLTEDEIAAQMIRAGGAVVCSECGKEYFKHPFIDDCLFDDRPYLHVICDGTIVKL